uniref:Uncharacterized protein n=1 Tax=Brassica oleracea var. oleracea TaxID=109376 RepID=A0A0D3AKB6_BRAOL
MAAQQAGYEAQRRLNQQMMEMMQRMYPNEVFPDVPDPDNSLGKFRGTYPSEYTEGTVPRNKPRKKSVGIFRGIIPTKFYLGIFRGLFRQTRDPRNFLGNLFPRNSVGKFRGISEEKRNSEELFPTTCFVGIASE